MQSLLKIFNVILEFCDIWRKGICYFIKSVYVSILDLEKTINDYFGFIYKILSSILNKNQSTHFQPLLTVLL